MPPRQRYTIPDWLGLNTQVAPEVLQPGELVLCENWEPDKPGSLHKRLGSANWGTESAQQIERMGFLRGADGDPAYSLIFTGSGLYSSDATAEWPPENWTVVAGSAGVDFGTAQEDQEFMANLFNATGGVEVVQDDLTYRDGFLNAPTATPTLSLGAAGNPSGTYYYKVAFRSNRRLNRTLATIFSNPSSESDAIVATSDKILVDNLPISVDGDATAKWIYRRKSTQVWFRKVAAVSNDATAYLDNIADASVVTVMEDRQAVPADLVTDPTMIAVHANRIFVAGDAKARVGFSQIDQPFYWGYEDTGDRPINAIDLPGAESEGYIMGLASVFESLIILTEQAIWQLVGTALSNFRVRRIQPIGCIAKKSVAVTPYGLLFLSSRGVESFDGSEVAEVSAPIRADIQAESDSTARGVWHVDRYILRVSDTKAYVFFPDTKRWASYTMAAGKWEAEQLVSVRKSDTDYLLGSGTSELAEVLKAGTYQDKGSDYTAEARSGNLDFGMSYQFKVLKRLQLDVDAGAQTGGYVKVKATPGSQGATSEIAKTVGTTERQYAGAFGPGVVGDDFRIDVKHDTSQQAVRVRRLSVEYSPRQASRRG